MCVCFSLNAASYGGKIGIDFTLSEQPTIGMKWHISKLYCVNPFFGFLAAGKSADQGNLLIVGLGNQFYLPSFLALDHYINISPAYYGFGGSGFFEGKLSYGLQYQCNNTISIFGELGIVYYSRDYLAETFRSGVGAIFYFK